jgi:hypothetical protein
MLAALALLTASNDLRNLNFIPTDGGFFDLLFHKTAPDDRGVWAAKPPFSINLIQLLIVLFLAFAINGATERLTGRQVGMRTAVLVTLIGSWLFSTYVKLLFDFVIEGVRSVAAILGALIIAVFYTLILGKGKK